MNDQRKTKAQLVRELQTVRAKLKKIQKSDEQRKHAKASLQESEERYRLLFENSSDAVLFSEPNGNILSANPAACRMFGRSEDEIRKIGRAGLVDTLDPRLQGIVEERRKTGKIKGELNHVRKDGTVFPAEVSSFIFRDTHGDEKAGVFMRDITERKRAEEALQKSEERYRSLFANMLDGFAYCKLIFDDQNRPVDFVYLAVNSAFEKVTGLTNVEGKRVSEVIPDVRELSPELFEIYGRVALTGKPEQFEYDFKPLNQRLSISVYSTEKGYFIAVFENITERKRAEEVIKASEEKYRMIFDKAPIGIAISTIEGKIISLNKAQAEMIGRTVEELEGRSVDEYYTHPDKRKEMIELCKKTGNVRDFEMGLKKKDGSIITELMNLDQVKIGDKEYLFATGRDISERKRVEDALRESEERFRTVAENQGEGLGIVDAQERFTFANPAAETIMGVSPRALVGRSLAEFVASGGWAEIQVQTTERRAGKKGTYEMQIVRPDGETRYLLVTAAPHVKDGTYVGAFGVFLDITERKRAEEELRRSEIRYRSLTENSPDLIARFDEQYRHLYVNPTAARAGRYSPYEYVGKTMSEVGVPEEEARKWEERIRTVFETGQIVDVEDSFETPSGSRNFHTKFVPEFAPNGSTQSVQSIARDITERKQAEANLKQVLEWQEAIFEGSRDAVFVSDQDSQFVAVNNAATNLTGYTRGQLLKMKISDLHEEPDLDAYKSYHQRILDGEEILSDAKIVRCDGVKVDTEFSNKCISIDGKPYMHTTARDITERKLVEKALRESEERFRELFNRMSSGVAVYEAVDSGGDFIFRDFNPAAERIEKVSRKDILGKRVTEAFPGVKAFGVFEVFQRVWQTGKPEYLPENIYKDEMDTGSWRENSVFKLPTGEIVAIYNDITERKEAEEALRASEERYRHLFDASPDGIVVIGTDGRITRSNIVQAEMYRFNSPTDLIGIHATQLVAPSSREYSSQIIARRLHGEEIPPVEYELVRKDGTTFYGETSATILRKGDGTASGYICVTRDTTERKRAEQIIQDERNLLRSIINAIPDEIVVKDLERKFVLANQGCLRALGKQALDQVIGLRDEELIPERFARDAREKETRVLTSGETLFNDMPEPRRNPDTSELERAIMSTKTPLHDRSGHTVGLVVVNRNITELQRAQETLGQSESRFRTVWNNALDAMRVTDADGTIVMVNQSFCQLFKKQSEELVGRSMADTYFPIPNENIVGHYCERFRNRTIAPFLETEVTIWNGEELCLELSNAFMSVSDQPELLLSVIRDVTERKQAERELRTSERRFREILGNVDLIAITLNREGAVTFCNDYMLRLTGWKRVEVLSADWFSTFLPDGSSEVKEIFFESISTGKPPAHHENPIVTKAGELREIYWNNTFLRDTTGNIIGMASIGEDITERKRAEEALAESERKLKTLFEILPVGVSVLDAQRKIVYVNPALERILDISKESLFKGDYGSRTYLRPDGTVMPAEEFASVRAIKEQRAVHNVETGLVKEDGTVVWTTVSAVPLGFPDWEVLVLTSDITERKRADHALVSAQQRLKEAHRLAHIGTWAWVMKNDTVTWSDELYDIAGRDPSLPAPTYAEHPRLYAPASWDLLSSAVTRALTTGEPYSLELELVRPDGSTRWTSAFGGVIRDGNGKTIGLHGTVQDISERKKAEQEIALLAHTLRSVGECVSVTDTENKILFVNKSFLRTYGYTADELIGKSIAVVRSQTTEPATSVILNSTLQGDWYGELVNRRKDSTEFPVALSTSVVRDDKGQPIALVGIAADITERKRAEERLSTSQEQLHMLAGHLQSVREEERKHLSQEFHDQLGQVLTAIKMDLSMLHRTIMDPGKELSRTVISLGIESMQDMIDRAIGIIREIMSELRPEMLDQLGIIPTLEWEAERFRRHSGVSCTFRSSVEEIALESEKAIVLYRIFQEAITNVARHAKATSVEVTLRKEGGELILAVVDNGKGISADAQQKTHSFGLIGMRERAILLGGSLEIRGVDGKGTTVVVRIPYKEALADGGSSL